MISFLLGFCFILFLNFHFFFIIYYLLFFAGHDVSVDPREFLPKPFPDPQRERMKTTEEEKKREKKGKQQKKAQPTEKPPDFF
jgi:hypothetical protein